MFFLTIYSGRSKLRLVIMNTTLPNTSSDQSRSSPAYQAFRILQIGFVAAPLLAGLDKFFHLLVNWDQYLPSVVARL